MSALIAKFYELIIYALLVLLLCALVFGGWQKYKRAQAENKVLNAEIACNGRVEEALKPYKDAEKKSQEKANEVSEEYETTREAERVRTEYITRDVQKIVERPIYINNCFDTDGVSAVNQAAAINHTSEP